MENKEEDILVKFKFITVDGETVTKILPYNQYLALRNLCDGMAKFAKEMTELAAVVINENSDNKNEDS